ncbi:MAG: pyridoxal-phosphate dependent enzyme [Synergistaceae bacterium]|nr:pyridoxal-phosphate dependent enzyme [Synergistaceae bacterium]
MNSVLVRTPIHRLEWPYCKNSIYIKRDDLLPFSFGGNKVRIALEFFRDMKAKAKDCIIGYGSSRSNLVRAAANIASMSGVKCVIISPSEDDGSRITTANTRIAQMCSAEFVPCQKTNVADTVQSVITSCEESGLKPYYINGDKYGRGNEAVPVRAYYGVYQEILSQQQELGTEFQYIFLPVGTGMTIAGLIAGRNDFHGDAGIIGISIARPKQQAESAVQRYVSAFSGRDSDGITVCDEYICGGYGLYDSEIADTVRNMLILNGVALDTTYTGKAFYGMYRYLNKHNISGKNILFIHTGGTPLFFDGLKDFS